ncbi:DUF3224 domain-containing protein [Nocardia vinacea]|uniref:DUF3224 domain-containing protein n=1 Tax=Nocardia vinacea TaxID=96468 RepID=A0ABZ1YVW3_9NOCA|nr:DUF3224 domain-containing protein [Nocardia vinacea]
MNITATTISLTVDDVAASRDFLTTHFGYQQARAAEGFVSLTRDDAAADIVLLRRGIDVLPAHQRDQRATGMILAFTVTGIEGEHERLRAAGATITMPLREEPWGERLFQVTDPNGIVMQLVEWGTESTADYTVPRTIQAEFEIDSWDEVPYHEPDEGPKQTRIVIRKTYRGALEGTGIAEVLIAQGATGAGYVASEHINTTLEGRQGTFVIQHGGLADGDDRSTFGTVVPHSGTADLAGLSGHAIEARPGVLTLTYIFDRLS